MKELAGVRTALWILVVGGVFASFAHPFFFAGHENRAPSLLLLPGAAFSVVGGLVTLYFVAAVERATAAITGHHGGQTSLVVLGGLGCIPGIRVVTDLVLLLRARASVASSVGDDHVRNLVGTLVGVRTFIQIAGVVPALALASSLEHAATSTPGTWIAVSVCPLASLVLLIVIARKLTGALVDRFQRAPLGGLGAAASVAVPVSTTRES